MNLTTQNSERLQQPVWSAPGAKLANYHRLTLRLVALVVIVVAGLTLLLRFEAQPENPFAAYANLFPGKPRSGLEAYHFACSADKPPRHMQYCTAALPNGPVPQISVTLLKGTIVRVSFTLRSDSDYILGDLALAWGRPQVRNSRQSTIHHWPAIGASANGGGESSFLNYFIPLSRVWMRLD